MGNDPFEDPALVGIEVDETLMGGKRKNVGRGYRKNEIWGPERFSEEATCALTASRT